MNILSEGRFNTFAEFEKAYEIPLNNLSFQELKWLNQMVLKRIKFIHHLNTMGSLSKLHIGDKVKWTDYDGMERKGVIIRINAKTASVQSDDDNGWWRISPHLLTKI
jgi:hypothetical protein